MKTFFQSIRIFVVLTLLTGVAYPLLVTLIGQGLFPAQAGGSLVQSGGQVTGSELLAQKFESPRYFWPRPSGADFATVPSGASNLGPTSAALKEAVLARAKKWREAGALPDDAAVPADLLFASGSGLDPHISPEAAQFQVDRVAKARGLGQAARDELAELVVTHTEGPQWGFLGERRVNVLNLNLALDSMAK